MDHLNEEMLERMDAYLSDEMSPQEKYAFESLFLSDKKLAREVVLQHLIRSGIKKAGQEPVLTEEKEKLLNTLQDIHNQHLTRSQKWINRPGFRLAVGAAASLLLVFFIVRLWPTKPSRQDMFAQYYSSPVDVSRGLTGIPENLQAFEKKGDFSSAIVYLDSVKGLDLDSRSYYKSHFFYLQNDSGAVFREIEPILADSASRYFDQVLVNKGLLYLKFGNTDLSYSIFTSIVQLKSRYISSKSQKIADEMLLFLEKEEE